MVEQITIDDSSGQTGYRAVAENDDVFYFKDDRGVPKTVEEMEWCKEHNYIMPAFRDKSQVDVDTLLDYVDLELSWYVPSFNAIKFMNFIRLCLGEEPENTNSKPQYFFIDCLFNSPEVKPFFDVRNIDYDFLKGNTVILATREFSKSVLIIYLCLFLASEGEMPNFGKTSFGLYVSDKAEGNVKTTMNTIEDFYNNSQYLQNQFEYVHFTDKSAEFIRKPKSLSEIKEYNDHLATGGTMETVPKRAKRRYMLKGLGITTGGRGARSGVDRPDHLIFDDTIRSDNDVKSETIMEKIENAIDKDIGGAGSGEGHFKVLIGTAYAEHDPVYSRASKATSWLPVVFPRAERVPDENMTEENFVTVWGRHTFEKQKRKYMLAKADYDAGDPRPLKAYLQEYFVRISSDEDRLIPKHLEQWYNMQEVLDNAWQFNWYLSTDYTTTGNSSSNNSAAFLWAVANDDSWFLVDMTLRKMQLSEQYANTFHMLNKVRNKARFVELGVEVDGQQYLHIVSLRNLQVANNTFITFAKQKTLDGKPAVHDGIKSSLAGGDKFWRFKRTEDRWYSKKIYLPEHLRETPDMKTFLKELKNTSTSGIVGSDDGLDAVSQMEMIDYQIPPLDLIPPSDKSNVFDDIIYPNTRAQLDPHSADSIVDRYS